MPRVPSAQPIVLPEPGRRALARRSLRTLRVIAREFGGIGLRRLVGRPAPADAFARPMRRTFEALGATYVKFGQLVASAPGVFGDAAADEFRSCLDTGPAVPFAHVRTVVESTLGRPLADAFRRFEEAPIGRASIAVVHRAELHDGRVVAVKVLRPRIERIVATDLRLMRPLFDFLSLRIGIADAGQFVRLLDGFREQVAEELDLRNEARAMAWFREHLARLDVDAIVVPATFPEHSGARVLTMDWLDGVPIDDFSAIGALGLDPRSLLEAVVRTWMLIAVREGCFHGDVHAGNLLLLRDGRLGVLDWGIVGRLDPEAHRFLRRTLEAALGDHVAWADVAALLQNAYGPALRDQLGLGDAELAEFVRSVMEPLLTRPFGEASLATLLGAIQGRLPGADVASRPTWRARLRRLRDQRRLHAGVFAHGAVGSSFDRGTFLLAKQLMYFERYGKLFMADSSLLADREFMAEVLGGERALTAARADG